jgi:hypothetical protein
MAEPEGNGLKSFIIGALLVLAAGLGWYIFAGTPAPENNDAEITIKVPDLPDAAPAEPAPAN